MGSVKHLRVVRDSQDVTVHKLLSDSTDLLLWQLLWQQGVSVLLEAQYALHDARFDLMLRATDTVATAYGNSHHARRAFWTTTRFRLVMFSATLSLLSIIKNDICEYLTQRLQLSDVVFDFCAVYRGHCSLGLLKPDAVTAAGETSLSLWTEESLLV